MMCSADPRLLFPTLFNENHKARIRVTFEAIDEMLSRRWRRSIQRDRSRHFQRMSMTPRPNSITGSVKMRPAIEPRCRAS